MIAGGLFYRWLFTLPLALRWLTPQGGRLISWLATQNRRAMRIGPFIVCFAGGVILVHSLFRVVS